MGARSSKLLASAAALLGGGASRQPASAPAAGPEPSDPAAGSGDRVWQALTEHLDGGLAGRTVLAVGRGQGERAWAELHPEQAGRYDIVICRDALPGELHPALLLERLRAMTADDGVLALGAVLLEDPALTGHARLIATAGASAGAGAVDGEGEDGPAWVPGRLALERVLAATGLRVERELELAPPAAGLLSVLLLARPHSPGVAPHRPPGAANRFPSGHYYSPLPDTPELARPERHAQVWPATPRETPGIDWREPDQLLLCERLAAQERLDFVRAATDDPTEYHTENGQYPALDAWILEAMLRELRPARMIEVGSGFSSLVSARVNREHLDGTMELTCIEPYPREFLSRGVRGIAGLRVEQIQDTPLDVFAALERDDVLFVDTSHTVKTGGDVTWIFHEILPRLNPGVVVHIHDAFLPGDYPPGWVMEGLERALPDAVVPDLQRRLPRRARYAVHAPAPSRGAAGRLPRICRGPPQRRRVAVAAHGVATPVLRSRAHADPVARAGERLPGRRRLRLASGLRARAGRAHPGR